MHFFDQKIRVKKTGRSKQLYINVPASVSHRIGWDEQEASVFLVTGLDQLDELTIKKFLEAVKKYREAEELLRKIMGEP